MTNRGTRPEPTRRPRSIDLERVIRSAVGISESSLYLIVGALLLVTALLVVTAAARDVVQGLTQNENLIEVGLRLLREILLLLIVAELLHSLRFVLHSGRDPG